MATFQRFVNRLKKPAGTEGVHGKDIWLDNDDVRPLKLQDRTWTSRTYFVFWFSAASTAATWYGSTAAQSLGLSLWESLLANFGGSIIISIIIALNGRGGAMYRVGYTVNARASFGVFGAWWPGFNRAVMAIVWGGVNAVQGGQCVYVMLHAIFPSIARIPNVMGEGSALDSGGMISFFVFWVLTNLFLYIPVPKMKGLVYTKLVVFLVSAIAMLAWCLTLAGGLGPVARQGSKAHGSQKSWLLARFIWLGAASSATFASNAADFQRYARRPNDVILGNAIGHPLANLIINLVGNLVGASSQLIFGELIWNPITILDRLQTDNYTAGNRAGCFFIALAFVYSAIFSSIFENSLPAGNDIAALFPRYVTVRRGFFIASIISCAINPWYLLGSASIFVTFLASYQIFLSSIIGVLLAHYYIVARGYFAVPDLFTSNRAGVYYYFHGFNYRAYVAYLIGIIPNFYGFLSAMGVHAPIGVVRFYYFAFPVGILLAFFSYWGLCHLDPPPVHFSLKEWMEPKDYIREEEREPVLEGASVDAGSEDMREEKKTVDEIKVQSKEDYSV